MIVLHYPVSWHFSPQSAQEYGPIQLGVQSKILRAKEGTCFNSLFPLIALCRAMLYNIVKVRVDVRCGAKITMPQPFLDLLHRNAVGQQKAGTAVPKVVQSNDAHAVGLR